jgi:hypothetical protein
VACLFRLPDGALRSYDYYMDTHRLRISVSNMKNANSREALARIRTAVLDNLSRLPAAPSAHMAHRPPALMKVCGSWKASPLGPLCMGLLALGSFSNILQVHCHTCSLRYGLGLCTHGWQLCGRQGLLAGFACWFGVSYCHGGARCGAPPQL